MADRHDKMPRRASAPGKVRLLLLVRWLNRHQPPEPALLMLTAILVGVGAGFGAILFRWLIGSVTAVSFEDGRRALGVLGSYYVILIPAIGGLLVGPLVYYFAREAKGHGVPEVMEAVALRGGRIRPRVALVKALASSVCIGSGGSAGREGPIVQIGSALGSTVGQLLQMSDDRIRMLVACGAAAGIAATFNAPVAGVLFALEIILGEFSAGNFATVVIASVTASVIARVFLGNTPAFAVPAYTLHSAWELLFYAALGILAALVAVAFIRSLYGLESWFDRWKFPEYLKPVVGGLGVGAIGLVAPQVFGVGYDTIEAALHNDLPLGVLPLWLLAKVAATSLTLASGGSGGVFAPALFMGAMLGGTFGTLLHSWAPAWVVSPGAYSLVGMAAVFAATANAPITAILILFEMSGDYALILPLMVSSVIAVLLARILEKESIYSMKLTRRGVRLRRGRDIDLMQTVLVSEVMTTEPNPVSLALPVSSLADHFRSAHCHACPVLDEEGFLWGIVSLQDLDRALSQPGHEELRCADIATRTLLTAVPDEPVWAVLQRMAPRDLSRLPVVDPAQPKRLVGVIRRRDIVRAYEVAMMRRQELPLDRGQPSAAPARDPANRSFTH